MVLHGARRSVCRCVVVCVVSRGRFAVVEAGTMCNAPLNVSACLTSETHVSTKAHALTKGLQTCTSTAKWGVHVVGFRRYCRGIQSLLVRYVP